MRQRLIIAIISTIAEEVAILVVGWWVLPMINVRIPLPVILAIMLLWLAWSVFTYRKGTDALLRRQIPGLVNLVGSTGVVVKDLSPDGLVKIRGEMWKCRSREGLIKAGTTVVITHQHRLRLIVRSVEADAGK